MSNESLSDTSIGVGVGVGTPLKAIDNICSPPTLLTGASSNFRLDDITSAAAAAMSAACGTDDVLFPRPWQTSTPAAGRRVSPRKKVMPLMDLELATDDGGYSSAYSQEGGFLPAGSQSQQQLHSGGLWKPPGPCRVIGSQFQQGGQTTAPWKPPGPRRLIDQTADDVGGRGEMLSFELMMTSGEGNIGSLQQPAKLRPPLTRISSSIGNFDSSFIANDECRFEPIAASTQISQSVAGGGLTHGKLCKRNGWGDFQNSFVDDTLKCSELETGGSGGGDGLNLNAAAEADLICAPLVSGVTAREEVDRGVISESRGVISGSGGMSSASGGVVSKSEACEPSPLQQQLAASRSSTPELFDCDDNDDDDGDAATGNDVKLSTPQTSMPPSNNTSSVIGNASDASHQSSLPAPRSTLAQKLANRKLKAEDVGMTTDRVNDQCQSVAADPGLSASSKQPLIMTMMIRTSNDGIEEVDGKEKETKVEPVTLKFYQY